MFFLGDWHQLILPKFITYSISKDGEKYFGPIKIHNPHIPYPLKTPDIVKLSFLEFKLTLMDTNANARFIKVYAECVVKMPNWFINAGKPAILLTDEAEIK